MASYYEQVQEAINNNEKELAHLNEELRGLWSVEKDTPRESFQRQHAQILYHIDKEQKRLEENKALLNNFHAARDGIAALRKLSENSQIERLRELLNSEKDPVIRREILEEIEARERENNARIDEVAKNVQTSMAGLTDELAEEVRQLFPLDKEQEEKIPEKTPDVIEDNNNNEETPDVIEDNNNNEETPDVIEDNNNEETFNELDQNDRETEKETGESEEGDNTETLDEQEPEINPRRQHLQSSLESAQEELAAAERDLQESITKLQEIFAEERTIQENEGPFRTEEELNDFRSEYMRRKIEENERFEASRKKISELKKQINTIENNLESIATLEEARKLGIDADRLEQIKKVANDPEVLQAIYDKKGLGVLDRSSDAGNKQASEVTAEIVDAIIKNLKEAGITNNTPQDNNEQSITDTINIIYGTDLPVKDGESRKTTISNTEKEAVQNNQKKKVKVRVVPHNGDEQAGKTPGPAPQDMPTMTTVPALPGNTGTTGETGNTGNTGTNPPTGTQPQKTANQLSREMDTISQKLWAEEEKLNNAKDDLTRAQQANASADEIAAREAAVKKAEDKYNAQLAKLKDKQKEYIAATADGKYDKVGTEKKKKLIVGDYITDEHSIPGNITTLRVQSGKDDGRPAFTDASAKVEGQIDGSALKTLPKEKPEPPVVVPEPPQVLYGPPTTNPPVIVNKPKESPRGLMTIMEELTNGLGLKAKDGKRYKASNIKVFKGFKEELSSGNYLYNIVHLVPAIIKLPFNLIRKAVGKIMLRSKSKENIKELKERLDKLSEADLMTIYKEYRGNKVIQERFPTVLNTLVEERMQKFALGKVTEINSELESRYQSAFAAMHQLDAIKAELAQPGITEERKRQLEAARQSVLNGQAQNIATIRQRYIEANNWLSGGLHGFSEDMKAATTKLSLVGKRFAKDHDLNGELLARQASLEKAEMTAIATGNDEMALRVFVENEMLLANNTEIKGSVFGRRSVGEKYYSPLVEQLDYRDDPFVRDLFTTIAVSSAAISTIHSVKAARDQAAQIAENNRRIAENNEAIKQVNQIGNDIASKRGTMMEGMEAQGMQDTLSSANEIERAVLDKTDWALGTSKYRVADNAGHSYYTTFYDSTKSAYENIAQQYAAGQISQAEAMQLMADLGAKTHQTFGAINTECLNILKPYAQTHPQFDLSAVQGAMEYLQANPNAVQAMNQAMIDVTTAGETLTTLGFQQLVPLTTLPSDITTVVINGAATLALASNINNSMGSKKFRYGNSVTEMVEEYANIVNENNNESEHTSTK